MKISTVHSSAMASGDFRLAPAFHVSSVSDEMEIVARFARTDDLGNLCGPDGMFRGPIFRRVFAPDPAHGRPYVTATDLEQAEVRAVSSLSKIHGALLDRLELHSDTIVISCSGVNLGKAFYVRPDMSGLIGSHDLIRLIVDPQVIPPGYLFAFLDSRFGRTALRQSTHGGSVRHIEPRDLEGLKVPRLGSDREAVIHRLVFDASRLLARHSGQLDEATRQFELASGLSSLDGRSWDDEQSHLGWASWDFNEESLRALNHDPRSEAVRDVLSKGRFDPLGSLCDPEYFRGKQVFKREEASAEEGTLLLGQRAAFRLRPEGRFISRSSVQRHRLRVPPGTVLIPSHGTLGARELYCRAVAVTPRMTEFAFSGDFFRCVPLEKRIPSGYLYAFLRSRYAFRLLRSLSSGGKQQELTPHRMAEIPVPRLAEQTEKSIADLVDHALQAYDQAVGMLTHARVSIEEAIDGSGVSGIR